VVRKTFLEYFEGKGHTIGTWRGIFYKAEYLLCNVQLIKEAEYRLEKGCPIATFHIQKARS
jgi:hypothetical protein